MRHSAFFLVVVDEDGKDFSVEGPMVDDRWWIEAVSDGQSVWAWPARMVRLGQTARAPITPQNFSQLTGTVVLAPRRAPVRSDMRLPHRQAPRPRRGRFRARRISLPRFVGLSTMVFTHWLQPIGASQCCRAE